jgi:hypothetical protein
VQLLNAQASVRIVDEEYDLDAARDPPIDLD